MRSRFIAKLSIVLALTVCCAALARGADKEDKDPKATKNLVTIKDRKFNPASLTIKAGDTVTWVNKDDHDHTVDADAEENGFNSGNLGSGDTFKHKFTKAGKFKYACSYHPRMKGTIVVVDE